MAGPFRDDNEAARQRADALEDELEVERAKTEQLHSLKPRVAATPVRARVATPSQPPSDAPTRSLSRRALDYVIDTLTDPTTDVTFGQLMVWWLVIGLVIGLVVLVVAVLR